MKRWFILLLVAISGFAALDANAQYTLRKLTNKSGSVVAAARVVVVDTSNASAFTTTTTEDASRVVGITTASCSANAVGDIAILGISEVYCAGAVSLGDYLGTTTTAGYAASNGTQAAGAFAVALEAGTNTNITCYTIGQASANASPPSLSLPDGTATIIQGTDSDIRYGYDEATDDRWEMNDGTNLLIYVKDQGTEGDFGITGDLYIQDDDFIRFGTDSDIYVGYDETTDDRLESSDGTNTFTYTKDLGTTGLFGVTGRLEAPQIGIAADTDLITLTADTVTVAGKFDAATGIIARQSFLGGNQYASLSPSADSPCFIYNRPTDTASVSRYGIECRQEPQPGGTASGTFAAVVGSARVVSNQTVTAIRAFDTNIQTGSGTSVAIWADSLRAAITNNGTGTITSYRGVRVSNSGSTGIVTNFYGLDVEANTSSGANAIGATAKYGLRIGDISGAGTTNRAIETGVGAVVFGDSVTMNGAANVMGDASTDALTFTGRCVLRSVTDAGPMTATGGTQREIVFNTSDSKFYGCTVTHATAATWVALN